MKISYDKQADAIYIQLSQLKPDGVLEVKNEINVDVTPDGKIVGIEILNASERLDDLKTIFSYEIDASLNQLKTA
ncbi:DUF2283 domain-containing protein [candidate division KSB1 bacterium]|nr:DUF2283 domain-containing protein [candidate division KSB1 bacterium]